MFSKSKRLPDGSYKYINLPFEEVVLAPPPVYFSVGKEYSPIPNDYDNVPFDDLNRYQGRRFLEAIEFVSSEPCQSRHKQDISISSTTTSSARTSSDDSIHVYTTSIKKLSSLDHGKYAADLDSLVAKIRSLESTIQTLELEKNQTHVALIRKDAEFKRILKNEALFSKQLEEKQAKIDSLTQHIENDNRIIFDLEKNNQHIQDSFHVQLESLNHALRLAKEQESQDRLYIHNLQTQLQSNKIRSKEQRDADIQQDQDIYDQEQNLTESKAEIRQDLSLKEEAIDELLNKPDDRETLLQTQFKEYREYMETTVVPYLRQRNPQKSVVLKELYEAKKLLNKQTHQMNELRSSVHWLKVQNTQLTNIVFEMNEDAKEYLLFSQKLVFHTSRTDITKQIHTTHKLKHAKKKSRSPTEQENSSALIHLKKLNR